MIARTGRTAVFPSFGLVSVTACLVFLALGAGWLPTVGLPAVFLVLSMSLGTTMPVVQTTVQMVAGPKNLGAASASVQFSRSIGAALGTALVGAVLFAWLAATDPVTAGLFAEIVERGPAVLRPCGPGPARRGGDRDRVGVPRGVPVHRGVQRAWAGVGVVAAGQEALG